MEELGFFGNPISTEFSTSERGQSASAELELSLLLVLFFKLYAPDLPVKLIPYGGGLRKCCLWSILVIAILIKVRILLHSNDKDSK